MFQIPGNQRFTASGVLGRTGEPKRVFFLSVAAVADTAGVLSLYNGTSASGTKYLGDLVVNAGSGNMFDFGSNGVRFENGCYVSCGATSGVSYAVIVYQEEK